MNRALVFFSFCIMFCSFCWLQIINKQQMFCNSRKVCGETTLNAVMLSSTVLKMKAALIVIVLLQLNDLLYAALV